MGSNFNNDNGINDFYEKERNLMKDRCMYCTQMFDLFCAKAFKNVPYETFWNEPYKPDWCPGRSPSGVFHS